jgi:hypothetical protein
MGYILVDIKSSPSLGTWSSVWCAEGCMILYVVWMQCVTVCTYRHADNLFKILHVYYNLVLEVLPLWARKRMGGCGLDCAGSGWIRVAGFCEISGGLLWIQWSDVKSVEYCCETSGGLWAQWSDVKSVAGCCELSGGLLWNQWRAVVNSVAGCCESSN